MKRGKFFGLVLAGAMAFPVAAIAQQTEEPVIPYQNGDRVEKSQVRDALNYYDIVFFSGDNIEGVENLALRLRHNDGINAVALTGWNVSECTVVFSGETINNPSPNATFEQFEVDRGWVRQYAKGLAGQDAHTVNGSCVIDHPSEPDAATPQATE